MMKTYIKYGAYIAFSLIAYFLLMKFIGLHEQPVFSAFNAILYGGGILRAMQYFKRKTANFSYAGGWQIGFVSGTFATFIFTAFMAVYMLQIDTQFADAILGNWGITYTNGVVVMLLSTILMGTSTAMVLSLTFMQLLKPTMNPTRANA